MPEPVTPLPEAESAPNLPYFVTRTQNNELPVYSDYKRGGNLKLTLVRKVSGDPSALRDALRRELRDMMGGESVARERVVVNERTRQVVIKGLVRDQVVRFLRERRF
jgi:large subunit ribosomal protein L49